jgi:hypothetical protein
MEVQLKELVVNYLVKPDDQRIILAHIDNNAANNKPPDGTIL